MSNNIIAVDCDQVVLDFTTHWQQTAVRVLERPVRRGSRHFRLDLRFGLTQEQTRRVWDAFMTSECWGAIPPISSAVEALRNMQRLGFHVAIITSVPDIAVGPRRAVFARLLPGAEMLQAASLDRRRPNGQPSKLEHLTRLRPVFYADDRWPHIREAVEVGVPNVYRVQGGHAGDGKAVPGIETAKTLKLALRRVPFLAAN